MLSALLVVTQTLPARMVLRALLAIAVGFMAIVVIVFAYYAANGELGRFLQLYYLIPPAVAAGYSDTAFYRGFGGEWGHLYYLLPFFLGALCVLSVIRLHPLHGRPRGWSRGTGAARLGAGGRLRLVHRRLSAERQPPTWST